jgi:orotidine-5'-phosphate decarboxylase
MKRNIIVALDGMSKIKALKIAKSLKDLVWGFKVNDLLFEDHKIIRSLKKFGNVFADAKLYDIPNTVANSVSRLSLLGADMITVHASGGIEMMKAAKKIAGKSKIIAVTVLTSQADNVKNSVFKLARDAQVSGLDGIVCSARELKYLYNIKLIKIIPGIRPIWYKSQDDQRRTTTPEGALKAGADLLVIGRPVTKSKNPVQVIGKIWADMKEI